MDSSNSISKIKLLGKLLILFYTFNLTKLLLKGTEKKLQKNTKKLSFTSVRGPVVQSG